MDLTGLTLIKVDDSTVIKSFDCGDSDLNEFLLEKSKHYQNELLAVTFLIEDEVKTTAFFSIFNDSVRVEDFEFASKNAIKRFLAGIVSHPKRHLENFPAIKIGRLGVCNSIQRTGFGRYIISYIINIAIKHNAETACKFITVDAYSQSLLFYERMGFVYFTEKDKDEETRQMYLDLTPIINAVNEEI